MFLKLPSFFKGQNFQSPGKVFLKFFFSVKNSVTYSIIHLFHVLCVRRCNVFCFEFFVFKHGA